MNEIFKAHISCKGPAPRIKKGFKVVKPVACALNVLQRDNQMFMGYLLQTPSALQQRLEYAIMKSMQICTQHCQAVLEGLGKKVNIHILY